jgi:uncharacterized cysteine cluster protein YcgN (CxxCxxCC family)
MAAAPPFWEKSLSDLDAGEWEALCDGCGKCCLHKLEDEDRGHIYPTNVACKLLDRTTARCSDYSRRRQFVPDCLHLTPALVAGLEWLPLTCAYRLRDEGKPLPDWHYLICGDRGAVHRTGNSVVGWTVAEHEAGPLEQHLVDRPI